MLLAQAMSYRAYRSDSEFCERILNIRQYIHCNGYERYVRDTQRYALALLAENPHEKTSGGALLGISCHRCPLRDCCRRESSNLLRQSGYSILLLPSEDIDIATRMVVARQLMRGFGLVGEKKR